MVLIRSTQASKLKHQDLMIRDRITIVTRGTRVLNLEVGFLSVLPISHL